MKLLSKAAIKALYLPLISRVLKASSTADSHFRSNAKAYLCRKICPEAWQNAQKKMCEYTRSKLGAATQQHLGLSDEEVDEITLDIFVTLVNETFVDA